MPSKTTALQKAERQTENAWANSWAGCGWGGFPEYPRNNDPGGQARFRRNHEILRFALSIARMALHNLLWGPSDAFGPINAIRRDVANMTELVNG